MVPRLFVSGYSGFFMEEVMDWLEKSLKYQELLEKVNNDKELQELKIQILGKKGELAALMSEMKDLVSEKRKDFGFHVNSLKNELEDSFARKEVEIKALKIEKELAKNSLDITLPGRRLSSGTYHPLTLVLKEVEDLFISMGYQVVEGEEIESDEYNFERANIPANHPARDMQDTFYFDETYLLRTHTTAVQTRVLEGFADKLPIKVICPGKTYRRDDDDATHSHQFSQIEGLVVGENITLGDLKGTLEILAKRMFGPNREIRFRPSYFQFTEPSVEVDVSCFNCGGLGCALCKKTGWIELLGSGMVHPKVLQMAGIDSSKYSGFAFGVGIERLAMLKYEVEDIRNFFINDQRFLKQFIKFE